LGGLFALYALLSRPGCFESYIATSPAIWWDEDLLLRLEDDRAGADLHGRLVLAVGGLEEHPDIPMLASFKMVTNVQRMAERLAGRKHSLEVTSFILEGESHTSVVPVGLTRGLRTLLGRRPPV
jgi:predicted alpha/beta superfamily hydrolase